MVIGPGRKDKGISAFVILADGEFLPENLNNEKVVVMRRGESTGRELKVVKEFGKLATPDLLKPPEEPVCNYSGDGNPLHQHVDGTWWFYEETWALENGPYSTHNEGYDALKTYCDILLSERKDLTHSTAYDTMEADGNIGLQADTEGNSPASS